MAKTNRERIVALEAKVAVIEKQVTKVQSLNGTHRASIEAANPQLGGVTSLPDFLATLGELTTEEREIIVDQALILIGDLYVHLPLKRAMHAVDPVQRLKLLRRRLGAISEREFHNEMISIFKELRDLHTNYILPAPFNQHTAFLPFLMEEYVDAAGPHYMVTRLLAGFEHETFGPGVEVTHWSGVPIGQAIDINADREAGSNEAARHVRGLDAMTVRPMSQSLPPAEEWVIVGYRDGGTARELRLPWQVFHPDPDSGTVFAPNDSDDAAFMVGVDLDLEETYRARMLLFAPGAYRKRQDVLMMTAMGGEADDAMKAFEAVNSVFPEVFEFRDVDTDHGTFGYIRIRTFNLHPNQFIPEMQRILGLVSPNGLILDVRGNGGGIITSGERMLQFFSDKPVEAERLHFINTDLALRVANTNALGGFAKRWVPSMELALVTSAVYSQGFPIEDAEITNGLGRKYNGKVVLITDARCYSTTDIFAAGFQDNGLGKILGVDNNTGAGGANVFRHDLVRDVLAGPNSPIVDLPNGANMRVAIRRTTRTGENAGLPLEDLGVTPNETHALTLKDLMNDNVDLINDAAKILSEP